MSAMDTADVVDDKKGEESNNCRMYEKKFPDQDELVLVTVRSVAEMGAYVTLNEYNGIEGMILLSELSRRRIRSINKLIRVGRMEVVVVLRVDKDKGYIDLSKRRVSAEDVDKLEFKYNKSKQVHSIMRQVSETCKIPMIQLYEAWGWDLYKRFGHAYDAFKVLVGTPDKVVGQYNLEEKVKASLIKTVKRRLTPQPIKIRADIEVTCFAYEGIDAVKAALKQGESKSTEQIPIKIKLVSPPLYVMFTTTLNKEEGIQTLTTAVEAITEEIKSRGGSINIKHAPRAVSVQEERALLAKLEGEQDEDDDEE
mmetsp:Transcript_10392/g.18957  ORF Transcript_10392/g.18957 Transcript_10392/m.18957 type:complete len:310 (-) Transcript_10392:344-1273(-)